jgi:hypothetical protein
MQDRYQQTSKKTKKDARQIKAAKKTIKIYLTNSLEEKIFYVNRNDKNKRSILLFFFVLLKKNKNKEHFRLLFVLCFVNNLLCNRIYPSQKQTEKLSLDNEKKTL